MSSEATTYSTFKGSCLLRAPGLGCNTVRTMTRTVLMVSQSRVRRRPHCGESTWTLLQNEAEDARAGLAEVDALSSYLIGHHLSSLSNDSQPYALQDLTCM